MQQSKNSSIRIKEIKIRKCEYSTEISTLAITCLNSEKCVLAIVGMGSSLHSPANEQEQAQSNRACKISNIAILDLL
jgi:hypothetical protein